MLNKRPVTDGQRLDPLMVALAVLTISVVWVRYAGIWHDSVLYTFQALSETDPARFGTDIFLAYGSQNQFTLFSPLYGALIKIAGVPWANLALYVAGVALWLAGAGFLSRRLGIPVCLAAALLAVLPMPYGVEVTAPSGESSAVFNAKEPFLTPRLYTEGLSLFGLGLMLQGRRYLALLPTFVGFILHPVMGLAVLLTGFVHETIKSAHRWRWLALAASGVLLVAGAGAWGLPPANRLFVTVQGAWLEAVLLVSRAGTGDWGYGYCQLLFSAALTATLLFDRQSMSKRLAMASLLASAVGLAVDYVGWGLLRSELVLQCQPWRVIWVLTVVSRIALARLLIEDHQTTGLQRPAFWIFLGALCVPGWLQVIGGLIGLGVIGIGSVAGSQESVWRLRVLGRKAATLTSSASFILSAVFAFRYIAHDYVLAEAPLTTLYALVPVFLQHIPNVAVACGLGILNALKQRRIFIIVPGVVMGSLASLSGILLLLNVPAVKGAQFYVRLSPLAQALPRSGDIYWEQYLTDIWFGLGRTSYLSTQQLSVAAFSRDAALELVRRASHLKVIGAPVADMRARVPWTSYNHPWAPNGLSLLCADQKIAYVIADRQPYRAIASFAIDSGSDFSFFVYDCASLTPE